jgi:hypothetical protein
LFQDIIQEIHETGEAWWPTTLFKAFYEKLRERLEANAKDSNVAGFKSVVCYRTGLEVSAVPNRFAETSALFDTFKHSQSNVPLRLANKPLNDLVVRTTLEIAAKYNKPGMTPSFFPPGTTQCPLLMPSTVPLY